MGSDLGLRHPDAAAARARRSLAAARAARDGITHMVDSLRVSKPPRAPPSLPQSRRHALIPQAEGRAQLEARIRTLEDMVAAKDSAQTRLKAQWGRALVKRRAAERERDSLRVSLRAAASVKKQFETFVADVEVPLPDLRSWVERVARVAPDLGEEVGVVVGDFEESISSAKDALRAMADIGGATEEKDKVGRIGGSAVGSDDDGRSVASYASSALGDDREAQVETLVELVEMLEVRLGVENGAGRKSQQAMGRAKRAVAAAKGGRAAAEVIEIAKERDRLRGVLENVMKERESVGGEDAALAMAAKAEAELREAQMEIEELRGRVSVAERLAEKAVRQEELSSKNIALESELRTAKKTVSRLVQERNILRRTAPSGGLVSNASSASKTPGRANSEAIRRILDWRQRASSENRGSGGSGAPKPEAFGNENGKAVVVGEVANGDAGPRENVELLPDRKTSRALGASPVKKRRLGMPAGDGDSINAVDVNSISERSLEVGVNDSFSAQSLPVQGFLHRHDSLLSAGNVSASADAITITNNRNIFGVGGIRKVDGLRDLLNGS